MKNIIIFLFIFLSFRSQIYRAMSQTPKGNKGLWIEVYDKHSQDPVSKNFISFETINNLPVDSALTKIKNEKTTRTWFGANLCELLETINISCEKIQKLSISAPDGYTSVLSGELLSSLRTAICAYQIQNQTDWNENYGYMRLVFPDLRNMYWVNSPNKMVITIGENEKFLHQFQFYFIDSEKLSKLIKKDLKENPYLAVNDLLIELNLPQNNFHVLTSDGLFREYPNNDINRYFVLQKQESGNWEINGISVPHGLKTREIFFLSSGNKGIFLKELTDYEQRKWEHIFWQPLVGENFSVKFLTIELVLSDGSKISLELTNKLSEKQFPLYQILKNEQKRHLNIDYFVVSW
jgi:hypothetical protein